MQDKRCCCLPQCSFSPALPSSSHLLFASTGDRPPPASVRQRCVADLNVTAKEKEGKWVCKGWGLWWVKTQQAVLGGYALSPSLYPSFCQHQVVCCLFPPAHLKCHSASPGQSVRAMQITYQHKAKWETCMEDKEVGKHAS